MLRSTHVIMNIAFFCEINVGLCCYTAITPLSYSCVVWKKYIVADFQKLQKAKEVLCNESKRKNYDLWKRSGLTISFHDWQALKDSVKTVSTSTTTPHKHFLYQIETLFHTNPSFFSQCTGLSELKRNPCWKRRNLNLQWTPKQKTSLLAKIHQKRSPTKQRHPLVNIVIIYIRICVIQAIQSSIV